MRILLDENVDGRLRRYLDKNYVSTVQHQGWSGKHNGELMQLAKGQFDVLVTRDRALPEEQDLASAGLAAVVLMTRQGNLGAILPHLEELKTCLRDLKPGSVVVIDG